LAVISMMRCAVLLLCVLAVAQGVSIASLGAKKRHGNIALTKNKAKTKHHKGKKGDDDDLTKWQDKSGVPTLTLKCEPPTVHHFDPSKRETKCLRPTLEDSSGYCPFPYELDGQSPYTQLQTEHWELRPLAWLTMVGMDKDELRQFMRDHQIPSTIRTKVLDLHDERAYACRNTAYTTEKDCIDNKSEWVQGMKGKECVPMPPRCDGFWNFHEDPTAGASCIPPSPHFKAERHGVIDDTWVSAVMRDRPDERDQYKNKADRAHQEGFTDYQDKVHQKNRHTEEADIWDFEINKNTIAH
jgi:hypothetical protein